MLASIQEKVAVVKAYHYYPAAIAIGREAVRRPVVALAFMRQGISSANLLL
jgi:hypothetical protein